MNNIQVISSERGTFMKIPRHKAREVFEEGSAPVYVMTSDRNPVNSPGTEFKYKKGCEAYFNTEYNRIVSFQIMLHDFGEWLYNDGYGHMPDKKKAERESYSYWVKINE